MKWKRKIVSCLFSLIWVHHNNMATLTSWTQFRPQSPEKDMPFPNGICTFRLLYTPAITILHTRYGMTQSKYVFHSHTHSPLCPTLWKALIPFAKDKTTQQSTQIKLCNYNNKTNRNTNLVLFNMSTKVVHK